MLGNLGRTVLVVFMALFIGACGPSYGSFYGTWEGGTYTIVVRVAPDHKYVKSSRRDDGSEVSFYRGTWRPDDEHPKRLRFITDDGWWGYLIPIDSDNIEYSEYGGDHLVDRFILHRTSQSYADPNSH